ncbi:MAG: iron dicitrate transport regulator FecR [Acidovorax sp.]|nr:iron dicitrate transport regulator FecR [Acidovorax sp.]
MTRHPPRPPLPNPGIHQLQGRTEDELTWFQRRSLVLAAGMWVAAGGWPAAHAQARSNVVELRGDVRRNGAALTQEQSIAPGDRIETGPGSNLVFAVGDSAFMVRQNSRVALEGDTPAAVKVLRIVSGAVASVWGRGSDRQIILPTATAGIRGTGVYAEVFADQDNRSYFCNCYGTVDLAAGGDTVVSQASYHQAFWGEVAPRNGRMLTPAGAINHTDDELEFLAGLVNQRTAWQIAGRKGAKDGGGALAPAYTSGPPGSRD